MAAAFLPELAGAAGLLVLLDALPAAKDRVKVERW